MNNKTTNEVMKNKPESKKNIFIGIIASLIIVIAVLTLLYKCNPKVKVFKAISKTDKEISLQKDFFEEVSGKEDLFKSYIDGIDTNMELNMISSNDEQIIDFCGNNIILNSLIDNKNKKVQLDLGLGKDDNTTNVKIYTDNNEIMFKADSIYDSWLKFNCENIIKQLSISNSDDDFDSFGQDFNLKFFHNTIVRNYTIKDMNKVIKDDYIEKNKKELNEIIKNITIEKLDKKKLINTGGKKQACKGYSISIKKEELNKIRDNFYEYALNDEKGRDVLDSYIVDYASSVESKSSDNKGISDISLESAVEILKDNISYNDTKINIYINDNGQAAGFDVESELSIRGEITGINLEIAFSGKDNIADDIFITSKFNSNEENLELNFNVSKIKNDNEIENKVTGCIVTSKDKFIFDISSKYDIATKKINGKVKFMNDDNEADINYDGFYSYEEENNKLEFNFDNIQVNVNEPYVSNELSLKALYSIKSLTQEIEEPNENKIDFSQMTFEERLGIFFNILKIKNFDLDNY